MEQGKNRWCILIASVVIFTGCSFRNAVVGDVPFGSGSAGIGKLRLAPCVGIEARLENVAGIDEGRPALRVIFRKPDETRRFLALQGRPRGGLSATKAVSVRCRLQLSKGQSARLALCVFEQVGGGCWYKVGTQPVVGNEFCGVRLPITSMSQTAFSTDTNGKLDWDQIDRAWLGLVIDGPAEGTLDLSEVRFTSEPFRPTQRIRITGTWHLSSDPALQGKVTTPDEGPDGKPCMKFEFTMPGHRHMFGLPSIPTPPTELEGYRGLRLTYKAFLPPGINGLLVLLNERGGASYYADPPPLGSNEWRTVTLPFEQFRLGAWSRDENGKLDLDEVAGIVVGMHGTGSVNPSAGTIWASDIEFVP